MEIIHGIVPGQLLQRDTSGKGAANVIGLTNEVGDVQLRVDAPKKSACHGWATVGFAENGSFSATVSQLKAGGPYRLKFRIRREGNTLANVQVNEIYVGDVWILAGQSNMEGVGNLNAGPKPHPMVRAFFMRDEWGIAEEKLHFLEEAVDEVHNGYGDGPNRISQDKLDAMAKNRVKGVGPGMSFAIDMYKRTKVPQGLIACAHGGTSMAEWSPSLKNEGGKSLYGAMIRRYDKLGQPVSGVLWYQGESDANAAAAKVYTRKMVELVAATRADMGIPKLPWLVVQLGCHTCPEGGEEWNSIQEQQRRLPGVIDKLDIAPAVDLSLDDGIHISGKGQIILGKRLARLADRMVHKNKKAKRGIALKGLKMVTTPDCHPGSNCHSLELEYSNVAGSLQAKGLPTGFSLLNAGGDDVCGIYKTTLQGNKVLLHTNMAKYHLGMLYLSYGHSRIPYCNIVDAENMSIPVIQTLEIDPDQPQAINKWQTAFLTDVPTIARAGYAKAKAAKGWKKAPERAGFGVLPKPGGSGKLGVYAMRSYLDAKDDLEAILIFGANAPFKIWLNGKVLFNDAKACAPLNPDHYREMLLLKKGRNELMVAFAISAPGAHIGIMGRVGTPDEKSEPRVTS